MAGLRPAGRGGESHRLPGDWCGGSAPDPGWCNDVRPPQDWCGSVPPARPVTGLLAGLARALGLPPERR